MTFAGSSGCRLVGDGADRKGTLGIQPAQQKKNGG